MQQSDAGSPMRNSRWLALLVLLDALLALAVVHRAQQHADANELRRQAIEVIQAARARHKAVR
jgi:hypothetical protein